MISVVAPDSLSLWLGNHSISTAPPEVQGTPQFGRFGAIDHGCVLYVQRMGFSRRPSQYCSCYHVTACGSQRCPCRVDRLTWVMRGSGCGSGTRALYQVGTDSATVSFVTRMDSPVSWYLSVIMMGLPILSVR